MTDAVNSLEKILLGRAVAAGPVIDSVVAPHQLPGTRSGSCSGVPMDDGFAPTWKPSLPSVQVWPDFKHNQLQLKSLLTLRTFNACWKGIELLFRFSTILPRGYSANAFTFSLVTAFYKNDIVLLPLVLNVPEGHGELDDADLMQRRDQIKSVLTAYGLQFIYLQHNGKRIR